MRERLYLLAGPAAVTVASVVYGACGTGSDKGQSGVCALAPPVDMAATGALLDSLPKTDAGLPIVATSNVGLPAGMALVLAYDKTLDDPVARWSDCVGMVTGCRLSCGSITGCVDGIAACADAKGGGDCCPSACNKAFHARLAAGDTESVALTNSYLVGDCVDGFTASLDGGS
jgi:hypothetical protein